ncbi:MAG: hypothetical protein ACRD3W_27070, partial [Terriglobales bacterium]
MADTDPRYSGYINALPTANYAPIDDQLFTPWLGEYTPAPRFGENRTEPTNAIDTVPSLLGNAAGDVSDFARGMGSLESLGMARSLEMLPSTAQTTYGALRVPDLLSQMLGVDPLGIHELTHSLAESPAVKEDRMLSPFRQGDAEHVWDAVKSIWEDPLNHYARPLVRGDLRSLGAQVFRHPVNTFLDVQAGGALAKTGLNAAKRLPGLGKAIAQAERPFTAAGAKLAGAKQALKAEIGRKIEAALPQLEADRVLKDIKGPLPLKLQRKFRGMRE